jgi:hypothetical protein
MILKLARKLIRSANNKPTLRYFDEKYYLLEYPSVYDHELSPLDHYLLVGWKDRLDPSAEFSTNGYLNANPDVSAIRVNPLLHFLQHGKAEGRTGWEKSATPPGSTATRTNAKSAR